MKDATSSRIDAVKHRHILVCVCDSKRESIPSSSLQPKKQPFYSRTQKKKKTKPSYLVAGRNLNSHIISSVFHFMSFFFNLFQIDRYNI